MLPKDYTELLVEIAWSQTTDNLRRRAIELIKESAGEIRTVIALDFSKTYNIWTRIRDHVGTEELPNRGPAAAIVWRSRFDENGQQTFDPDGRPSVQVESYKFCDNDGKFQRNTKFQLSLRDFIPFQVIIDEGWDGVQALDDTKLEFDSTTFIEYFDEGLEAQKQEDACRTSRRERQAESRAATENERRL
ncbi:hypothetical protein GGR58DRAFT_126199 [Xylaria digitata]|nr:hypothetical protein GGR58DRAFT_126199 [Xylaria digitata]